MFFKNKICKLGVKFTQKHESSSTSTLSDEDMLKKLKQYQKKTFLNQELSRRRSIDRFYSQNFSGEDEVRDRAHSMPHHLSTPRHSPLMRVESDALPRKRVIQRTDSTQSDDYIACGVHRRYPASSRLVRQVTYRQAVEAADRDSPVNGNTEIENTTEKQDDDLQSAESQLYKNCLE